MSSAFARSEESREISEVNVVPLADVSLVLLIILLVLSPMMTQSMLQVKTAARSAEAAAPPAPEEKLPPPVPELVLAVALGPNGIAVGDRFFTRPGDFMDYMKEELSRRSDKKVFLSPHPDATHGLVVHTLEMIKACGADKVALVQTQEAFSDGQIRPAQAAP